MFTNLGSLACPFQATLPESPRWLLLNGAPRDQAVRALVRAEGKRAADRSVVEAEVDEMADNIERIQREGADNPMQLFRCTQNGGRHACSCQQMQQRELLTALLRRYLGARRP